MGFGKGLGRAVGGLYFHSMAGEFRDVFCSVLFVAIFFMFLLLHLYSIFAPLSAFFLSSLSFETVHILYSSFRRSILHISSSASLLYFFLCTHPLTATPPAVFALPGYTLKGVERELSRHRLSALQAEINLIRLRQAWGEVAASDEAARRGVLERWEGLVAALEKG